LKDSKPKAWEKLRKGNFKQGDQILYDAELSPFFRGNLVDNSDEILRVLLGVKQDLVNLGSLENSIFDSLGKLYYPFTKVLKNIELEKFINYADYTKNDRRLSIETL